MRLPGKFTRLWRTRSDSPDGEVVPLPWRVSAALVLILVIGGSLTALWFLDRWAGRHTTGVAAADAPLISVRLDAIKTALTVGAGLGAGVTLLLALRRQSMSDRSQRTAERAQLHAEQDAAERRITELYVAAAQLLSNDGAPARLSGLYALERIGNDHPKMRQTIVDVWCAYLRMPYTPPAEILRTDSANSPEHLAADAEVPEPEQQPERRQELQVRLTAQRLLTAHLRAPEGETEPDTYWRGPDGRRMNLDLTGTVLVVLDLTGCQPGTTSLAGAQLHGDTYLSSTAFRGDVNLSSAMFHGNAYLTGVRFHGYANLIEARFHGNAYLIDARFHEGAHLIEARFHGKASLNGAQFHGDAHLDKARFRDDVSLEDTTFHGNALLMGVQFHAQTHLTGTRFSGMTDLTATVFHRQTQLSHALFAEEPEVAGMRVASVEGVPGNWAVASEPGDDGLYAVLSAVDRIAQPPAPKGSREREV